MLIGREVELARVDAQLEAAAGGESSALVILGEAGIGKSTLLAAAVDSATSRGATVLRARGVEAEADIAFAGLSELLAPVLDLRERLSPDQTEIIDGALALAPGSGHTPAAVGTALVAMFAAAADTAPLVLVAVDDAHWLDEASREALVFATRRLGAEGVVVVMTARPQPDRGLTERGLEVLVPGGLSDQDAARVLKEGAERIADEPLERLIAAARGNPLALVELPRSLTEEQRAGASPLPEPVRPSAAIERAFTAELDALPLGSRGALILLAADESVDARTLAAAMAAAGLQPDALDAPERDGLVRRDGDSLRFRHPLLRSVLYHSTSFAERQAAHAALADAMREGASGVRRSWHLAASAAAPDEGVAAALEATGDDARGRGALSSAAHALALSAELTPDAGIRARRRLAAARDFAGTVQPRQAIALAERALGETDDPSLRAELQQVISHVLLRSGEPARAHDVLQSEAKAVADIDPNRAARMLLMSCVADRLVTNLPRMRGSAERALALVGTSDPVTAALAEMVLAHVAVLSGDAREGDALLERNEWLLLSADPGADIPYEMLATTAQLSIWTGRYDRAGQVLARLIGKARRTSDLGAMIYPLCVRSLLALRRGQLTQALTDGDEAQRLGEDTGQPGLVGFARSVLSEVTGALGHEEDCRAHYEAALAFWTGAGSEAMQMYAYDGLGLLALGAGRPDEAIGPLTLCGEIGDRLGMTNLVGFSWAPNLVEAYVRTGDVASAEPIAQRLYAWADASGSRWSEGWAARTRGILAPDDQIDELFGRSAEDFESVGARFELARTHIAWGERLRRARRRSDSRVPLRLAVAAFDQMGARGWAERARSELNATGETLARHSSWSDDLTPHERRVALLVAEGRTNPEVAAELFVSRKTVEYHLSQVYRKLGVRSRVELAAKLSAEQHS